MRSRTHLSKKALSDEKRLGVLAAATLVAAVVFRHPLAHTMALHMLVHIPLVVVAGVLAAMALRAWRRPLAGGLLAAYRRFDEYGVPGLLLASFAGAFWMVPRTLDYVLASPSAECLKFAVMFIVGLVLYDALARANTIIRLFFLGNFCWMMAVVGIAYQNAPSRLCNFYLASDQQTAGVALVVLAACLPILWLYCARKQVRRFLRNA